MKAHDIFQLAEMIAAFKKPQEDKMLRSRRRGPPRHAHKMSDESITTLLQRKLEEADTLRKMLEDREKANKKEDKKKDGPSIEQIAIFLMLTYPIIGATVYLIFAR